MANNTNKKIRLEENRLGEESKQILMKGMRTTVHKKGCDRTRLSHGMAIVATDHELPDQSVKIHDTICHP